MNQKDRLGGFFAIIYLNKVVCFFFLQLTVNENFLILFFLLFIIYVMSICIKNNMYIFASYYFKRFKCNSKTREDFLRVLLFVLYSR